jgi:hypothetical protein
VIAIEGRRETAAALHVENRQVGRRIYLVRPDFRIGDADIGLGVGVRAVSRIYLAVTTRTCAVD